MTYSAKIKYKRMKIALADLKRRGIIENYMLNLLTGGEVALYITMKPENDTPENHAIIQKAVGTIEEGKALKPDEIMGEFEKIEDRIIDFDSDEEPGNVDA